MEWEKELKVRLNKLKILREHQLRCQQVMKRYKNNEFVQEVIQQTRGMIEGLTISINSLEDLMDLISRSRKYNQKNIKVVEDDEDGSIFLAEGGSEK